MKKETPSIKILVACHKPSVIPDNDLFLPIHVGAAAASIQMDMQRDNLGENISCKNANYCELTAQFWAWKNLKADYIGLCHYRRYLCFQDNNAKRNLRGQIETGNLNQFNIERFGLDDSTAMRHVIEQYDIITGPEQEISQVPTPRGKKKTALAHWLAHDRTLIRTADFDRMLDILKDSFPELWASAKEYLNSSRFLGFNCFVMKKQFFDELCAVEFKVLSELEKQTQLDNHYGVQLSRIYGFFGEIISSIYIYHVSKKKLARVKHVPLIYFNYTDLPAESTVPGKSLSDSIPVIFNFSDVDPVLFTPTWHSFLEHIDKQKYEVLILFRQSTDSIKTIFRDMAATHKNISISFYNTLPNSVDISERYPQLAELPWRHDDSDYNISVLPFLPFIFQKYHRAIVLNENIIFDDSLSKLWDESRTSQSIIYAPRDTYQLAAINDIFFNTAEKHLSALLQDPYSVFSIRAFVWDFTKYRAAYNMDQVANIILSARLTDKADALNKLCEQSVEYASPRWDTWLDSNPSMKDSLERMPVPYYKQLLSARQDPGIIAFLPTDPQEKEITPLYLPFWQNVQSTPLYHAVQQYYNNSSAEQQVEHTLVTKIFPLDSGIRQFAKQLIPENSRRYKLIKKLTLKQD